MGKLQRMVSLVQQIRGDAPESRAPQETFPMPVTQRLRVQTEKETEARSEGSGKSGKGKGTHAR